MKCVSSVELYEDGPMTGVMDAGGGGLGAIKMFVFDITVKRLEI